MTGTPSQMDEAPLAAVASDSVAREATGLPGVEAFSVTEDDYDAKLETGLDIHEGSEAIEYETQTIDPRGDLWVLVHGVGSWGPATPLRFRVCSRALARKSPVFEKMLYGDFAESQRPEPNEQEKEWVLTLPESPPLAMKQLFKIMHCSFDALEKEVDAHQENADGSNWDKGAQNVEVYQDTVNGMDENKLQQYPPSITRQLYDLTVVADFFDCASILKPWVSSWVKNLEEESYGEDDAMHRAWIYYQTGQIDRYEAIVTQLALHSPYTQCIGDDIHGEFLTPSVLPAEFLDSVASLRLETITALIGSIRDTVDLLLEGGDCPVDLCKGQLPYVHRRYSQPLPSNRRVDCEARMLGFLQRELHKHNLLPLPLAETLTMAPVTLYYIMEGFSRNRENNDDTTHHYECVIKLGPEGGFDTYRYQASEQEIAEMARKRSLTGIA
ncbi:uncharacterized protein B0I36DRAFT_333194 [Microdochium trichocladiopsis]|uniref:BTB domain-containing protein n=1 Tax=Microdochium trichocladiopsis TaxID=1682393 RepID=A0A9P9BKN7_9PEZI|nr:uncharacterized protein B0I36DRAFT_333194 [Microdochium trichocladiopsis]KAH7020787.1 hypothetical protein B0I36DRAFT_333194 [Microdochium trichocladiopsis]